MDTFFISTFSLQKESKHLMDIQPTHLLYRGSFFSKTDTLNPLSASVFAAAYPAGPTPTIAISTFYILYPRSSLKNI